MCSILNLCEVKMKKYLIVVMFLILLAVVSVSSAQDTCIRDSFFPDYGNCGYDVQDYNLNMAWKLDGDQWDVSEVLTFVSEWDTDELWFDFIDSYEITSLMIDGQEAEYDRQDNKLIVHYDFAHDTEYKLYAAFNGKFQWGELFDDTGETRNPADGFCMLNEPNNAWRFYICNDHPKDKATYHYSLSVPADYVPAGNGRLLMIEEANETLIIPGKGYERSWDPDAKAEDGMVTFTFAVETQTAPYLFTACAGAFDMKLQTNEDGKMQLDFVDRGHNDTEKAWKLTEMETEIISAFEEFFGPYPYEDLGAIVAKTQLSAALETQGRSLYDADTTEDFVFAHETAHQWFGDLISLQDWSDLWIKEGAATYGQALWEEHKGGEEAYTAEIMTDYEMIANGGHKIVPADDEFFETLTAKTELNEKTIFDHEKAAKAAAMLCGVPMDQVPLHEGDVSFSEWTEAVKASCTEVRYGPRVAPYLNDLFGTDAFKTEPEHYAGPKEIEWANYDELYGSQSYQGGAIVYHSLRYKLGDDMFKKCLQTLLEENKWGHVNEDIFIETFNRVSGEDLTDFIKSYLYYGENGHIPDLLGIETWEEARAKYELK